MSVSVVLELWFIVFGWCLSLVFGCVCVEYCFSGIGLIR